MTIKNLGVIGFGHLGRSFVTALLNKKLVAAENIFICDISQEALDKAAADLGVHADQDINKILAASDCVCFALRKDAFLAIAPAVDQRLLDGKPVVSFMAGTSCEEITAVLGPLELTRVMPTTSMTGSHGLIGYMPTQRPELEQLFHGLGYAFETEESDIERVMAYASCGLGFTAFLIDAYIQAGVDMGFSAADSQRIAEENFFAALELGNYPNTIKTVATKGGATEAGVNYLLHEGRVVEHIAAAVQAAYDRMTK